MVRMFGTNDAGAAPHAGGGRLALACALPGSINATRLWPCRQALAVRGAVKHGLFCGMLCSVPWPLLPARACDTRCARPAGNSVCVFVYGFDPYFWVQCPEGWGNEEGQELQQRLNVRPQRLPGAVGDPACTPMPCAAAASLHQAVRLHIPLARVRREQARPRPQPGTCTRTLLGAGAAGGQGQGHRHPGGHQPQLRATRQHVDVCRGIPAARLHQNQPGHAQPGGARAE